MKKRSVVYLLSGKPHLPYLAVSLDSLSKYYSDFDVRIYAWPESYPIVERMVQGTVIQAFEREPNYRGKNSQFIDKIDLMNSLDCHTGLYLDADTIIQGDITPLFEYAEESGFCITQFGSWVTTGGVIRNRIKRLIDREPIEQDLVDHLLNYQCPSVNGGVFSCKPNNDVLKQWHEWTFAVRDIFIADETVLHAIMLKYFESRKITVLNGGKFNCSPKYQPDDLTDEDIVIWHGHGDSFIRPSKSPKGVYLWYPTYLDLLNRNVFEMSEWINECIGNTGGSTARYMRELATVPVEFLSDHCLCCHQPLEKHNVKCPLYARQESSI